ncbi:MAG TPA: TIGR04551 family protein [Polyangiaceae bacterium]
MILRRSVLSSSSALVGALLFAAAFGRTTRAQAQAKPEPRAPQAEPAPPAGEKPTAPKPAPQQPEAGKPAEPPAAAETSGDAAAAPPATAPAPTTTAPQAPPPAPQPQGAPTVGVPLWPEPSADATALQHQGDARPKAKPGIEVNEEDRVYAEDWWSHARPILELHGYFRVRAQLFHKFGLGRVDAPDQAMWPRPADDYYGYATRDNYGGSVETGPQSNCTPSESGTGASDSLSPDGQPCHANMQAGANMRFRLNPELHISDNLRVISQVDLLDNLVLGSTPGGYDNQPGADGGYAVSPRNGYAPLGFYDDTQNPPSAGKNSVMDSIRVKRAWAEYSTPVGELRFGRMPFHWGLGMLFNGGDGHDDDYQSTVDRVQVIAGIKPLDLYFSAALDFPNEGITSDAAALPNPEPYDLAELDDVDQYVFSIARKKSPQLERLSLTRGEIVINGGLQVLFRQQTLANDRTSAFQSSSQTTTSADETGDCAADASPLGCPPGYAGINQFVRRQAHAWIPDLWLELKYKKFRFGGEFATVQGSIGNIQPDNQSALTNADPEYDIRAWGIATEFEQKLAEDRLNLGFKFGWASGDADVDGLAPPLGGAQVQLGDRTFETFRFHPSYRVDMILGRHILTREQGTYYFRPSADYDFVRDVSGQRLGGGLAAIWTRASQFMQSPGHDRDLGIELNGRLYYQSKDGALNDLPGILGGFFTEIDYGVLFPMAGLGYTAKQQETLISTRRDPEAAETRIAQTLRWYLGVLF